MSLASGVNNRDAEEMRDARGIRACEMRSESYYGRNGNTSLSKSTCVRLARSTETRCAHARARVIPLNTSTAFIHASRSKTAWDSLGGKKEKGEKKKKKKNTSERVHGPRDSVAHALR